MAVPEANKFYRAVLEVSADTSQSMSTPQMAVAVSAHLRLTEEQLAEMVPSGIKSRVEDRTQWAMYHLEKAGLLERPSRGIYRITDRGIEFLRSHQGEIQNNQIRQMQEVEGSELQRVPGNLSDAHFLRNRTVLQAGPEERHKNGESLVERDTPSDNLTPYEIMDICYREQRQMLIDEIIDSVKDISPTEFEKLVVGLLKGMGYGDGKVTGKSGDGGIDGILNQDALGLEKIYIQAKRFDYAQVGEPEIRNFSGSLDPFGANKGVFITTSSFSATARRTAENISRGGKFIRLIDGQELAALMISHGVGVVTEVTYEVKKLDANYFAEL